jgi:acyl carrier protein
MEFLGRTDHQVKVRGFRIELGEIEAALCRHTEVREAVVVARDDQTGQKQLVGYVVAEQQGQLNLDELRSHLKQTLPAYMVPSAFVTLDALPLTPNGKVDRKALPAPDPQGSAEDRYVAPSNELEEVLASIWANLLGINRVGVEESFFDLGGHSLLATRVISRVRELLRVELPLRSLFEAPTVARFALLVEEHEPRAGQAAAAARLLLRVQAMSADEARRRRRKEGE